MVYVARPLRWILASAWRYATPILLALGAFWAFNARDDVQGIASLLLATGYIFLLAAMHGMNRNRPSLNRSLAIVAYSLLAFGLLVGFGSNNRRIAPVLNQVLPHVGLEVDRGLSLEATPAQPKL